MNGHNISRRGFMGRSIAGAVGAIAANAVAQTPAGTGKQMNLGLIGGGIRGLELMQEAIKVGARIAVVCDLYDGHLRRAQEIQPNTPVTKDYQEVVARKDLDAVIVATSDHWHSAIATAAMRAGKHVYCEKPMTHTIPEALEMVRVSKETGRVVQVGSQSLSMASTHKGKTWLDSGAIGTVYMVQCEIYRPSAIGA
jgi:predicted dehydrogenase